MVSPSEYGAILGGEARLVDVAAIEHELTQLWKAAAQDSWEGQPVVRACVLNLVAYASGDDVAQHINEVISQVSGRHPSRSIVIVAQPRARSARLRASISAHCQIPPEGGKQVCSEQITLRAGAAAVNELHGTVLPLLVPDLPVFLWWHDEPPAASHLLPELLGSADHLVVDSADFPSEGAAAALARLQRLALETDVALSDLNWSRLTHWRELVAQLFDAPPGRRYLDRLDEVEVEIASTHGEEADLTEGLLMVGWMASRLGWTREAGPRAPRKKGVLALKLRGRVGPVAVKLRPDPAHPGEGLHSLSLTAGAEASFSISRKPDDGSCVVVAAQMPESAHSRVVRMELPSEAALLCEKLDMPGPDPPFREALAHAVRFMHRAR